MMMFLVLIVKFLHIIAATDVTNTNILNQWPGVSRSSPVSPVEFPTLLKVIGAITVRLVASIEKQEYVLF